MLVSASRPLPADGKLSREAAAPTAVMPRQTRVVASGKLQRLIRLLSYSIRKYVTLSSSLVDVIIETNCSDLLSGSYASIKIYIR
jgi:hypothetical protein